MTPWPFVGRRVELATIRASARAASGALVVSGAAGVGKTRLVREALAGLDPVWVAATTAAASVPLGAFAPHVTASVGGAGIETTLVVRDTLRAIAARRSTDRRAVLVVDDAHLLDPTSAALVHHAAQHADICLVAITRCGESTADAVTALTKDGLCDALDVLPLALDDVADFISDVVGAYPERSSVQRLWELSQGLPARLAALFEMPLGGLRPAMEHAGVWRLAPDFPIAASLRALAERTIDAYDRAEVEALSLVAFGEPIPLAALVDQAEEVAVNAMLARGVVAVTGRDDHAAVRMADPLIGEVIRRDASSIEARGRKARLVALMGATPIDRDAVRVAHWALDIGAELSVDELEHVTGLAERSGDWVSVERFASILAERAPTHDVAVSLMSAYQRSRRPRMTLELIERAREWPGDRLDEFAFGEMDARAGDLGDVDGARAAMRGWWDAIGDDAALGEAHFATILASLGEIDEAAAIARRALEHPDLLIKLRALTPLSTALIMRGETTTVLRLTEELMAASSDELSFSDRGLYVGAPRVLALLVAGELDQADMLLQMAAHIARSSDNKTRASAQLGTGRLRLLQGRPRSAAAALRESGAEFVDGPDYGRGPWAFALAAEALALSGDVAAAERARAAALSTRDPRFPLYDFDSERALAWVKAARGEISAARAAMLRCAADAEAAGMKPFELMALHDALRLGASNTLSQFRKLETEVDGPMATLFARHAAAKNDGPALDALATDFEQLGFVLYAAEAAAEASRAHARSGASVLAVRAAERSEDLRARCEGASTPALMAPNPGVRLTAREREIALMASRGVSSRDIAAALQLSVRTVDNNLGRVYTKLGVSSRTALSELFESTGKTE
ncbi:MAG: hypothetical protein QOJ00_1972 [Actinomycetota bacterium]